MPFHLRPSARADIALIAAHIAASDPGRAAAWLQDLEDHCTRLPAAGPARGRPELRPGLRHAAVGSYLVLFRDDEGGPEVVRVLHGASKWQELL